MAGASVSITMDDVKVEAMFDRLLSFAEGDRRKAFLGDIGEAMKTSTEERATQEIDPMGDPWVPLSPKYAAWKARKRPGVPILKFDFHMLGDMLSWQYSDDGSAVLIGTNAIYGSIHQNGGFVILPYGGRVEIPARPFLGLSTADSVTINEIADAHLLASIEGVG